MKNIDCPSCGVEEIETARLALGYRVCLTCGEKAANTESNLKRGRIALAYDKGGYQYITEGTNLEDLG